MLKIYTYLQPKLELFSLIVKGLGALLILLSLLGVFKHHNRIKFFRNLEMKKEISADSPIAKELMREFKLKDEEITLTKKIKLEDLRYVQVGQPNHNTLIAEQSPDKPPKIMGDLSQLRQWVHSSSKLYEWLGFTLVNVGFAIDIMLYWKARHKLYKENLPL